MVQGELLFRVLSAVQQTCVTCYTRNQGLTLWLLGPSNRLIAEASHTGTLKLSLIAPDRVDVNVARSHVGCRSYRFADKTYRIGAAALEPSNAR